MLSEERITAIKQILIHHVGKANAINARQIATQLEIPDNDTFGSTRRLISRIIQNEDLPIGAYKSGFYIIDNQTELKETIKVLTKRVDNINRKISKVKANYQSYHVKLENFQISNHHK